jgi:hypothetical protein
MGCHDRLRSIRTYEFLALQGLFRTEATLPESMDLLTPKQHFDF